MAYLGNTIVNGTLKVLNDVNANKVSGDGSGLTTLNASNISSGTLNAARLATSGATAGSYGLSAAVTGSNGTTMNVPYITVDTYGRITAISNKVYTSKDTVYTHPDTAGNKHIPAGGSSNQVLVYSAAGTAAWGAVPTHTHSDYLTAHQTIKQDAITGATANRFGTCSTAAGTAAKTVSITAGTPTLEAGLKVTVKFNNANTANSPTLNVNSLGAKNIFHKGARITSSANKALLAGVCDFVYDGTQFHLVGNYIDIPDTMSASEASTGTSTTARTITAKVLSDLIDAKIALITNGDEVSY